MKQTLAYWSKRCSPDDTPERVHREIETETRIPYNTQLRRPRGVRMEPATVSISADESRLLFLWEPV